MCSQLLEEFSRAIGARLLIQFIYEGCTYKVEPHLLGRSLDKKDCLLGWIISSSGSIKELQWKTFLLDQIEQFEMLEERFCKQRPGYDPYDNTMSRIYYRL
jgi:hypothetical protein